MGLACAALTGLALIASVIVAQTSDMARQDEVLARRLGLGLLAGLIFVNLALAFVLDWNGIGIGWAASGLLLLWLGQWQRQPVMLYFGAALEAVAGVSFLYALSTRLAPSGAWAPVVLALAAVAGAWRMHHVATRPANDRGENAGPAWIGRQGLLSSLLLSWGMAWWVWAAVDQIFAFTAGLDEGAYLAGLPRHGRGYLVLLALSLSSGLWTAIARRANWRALALFACGLPLAAATWLLATHGPGPLALGAPVWTACFIGHLLSLRRLADLYPDRLESGAHVAGAWLFVGVLTLAGHDVLASHPAVDGAWPWLGWALAPSLYLAWAGGERGRFWPLAAFPREYRFQAALPMMLAMLAWLWAANALSTGDAAPLPYLPLVNPLELGLLLVLLACWRWSRAHLLQGAISEWVRIAAAAAGGVSFLAFITMAVCRAAHFWAGVPFHSGSMAASMEVQAGWSLGWSLFALALMIGGSRRGWHRIWMAGAALIALVVAKLFFVELGDQGGLARIVSFIGVGVLLLIVGYFSPLPPKAQARPMEDG
jgi:uncharacterized membrane protein